MAWRRAGWPRVGGYWFGPSSSALAAASRMRSGPSSSGKPCPRLMAPCSVASADITVKMVVPSAPKTGLNEADPFIAKFQPSPPRTSGSPPPQQHDQGLKLLLHIFQATRRNSVHGPSHFPRGHPL